MPAPGVVALVTRIPVSGPVPAAAAASAAPAPVPAGAVPPAWRWPWPGWWSGMGVLWGGSVRRVPASAGGGGPVVGGGLAWVRAGGCGAGAGGPAAVPVQGFDGFPAVRPAAFLG
ncbi:hypothetical protein GCM10010286_40540 [Streptomyces toxytricini]|nr:hypothetical protein GCM10010286_40540 [Streptomyces toxytricini]